MLKALHSLRSLSSAAVLGIGLLGFVAPVSRAQDVSLTSAGSTFVQPLYETMIAEFAKTHPNVRINYGGGGSGLGIKGITDKTLAFAGSDAPMTESEMKKAGGAEGIIQVPSCAGGVVPAYNVPGVDADLKFTGQILANIYIGKITNWNDPAIAQANPDVKLPDLSITPGYRSDGSGTNFVWTNYLASQSDDFKGSIGVGKQVKWPLGQGGQGNPGVAAIVKQTPGAIGYLEQNFADKNGIKYGLVQNKAGKFVKASPDSVALAGASAADKMNGTVLKANVWNQDGDGTYPISSFTYLIAYKDLHNLHSKDEAQAVVDFFHFATHDGQALAPSLFYAPLAPPVSAKVDAALDQFTYQGQAIKAQ